MKVFLDILEQQVYNIYRKVGEVYVCYKKINYK